MNTPEKEFTPLEGEKKRVGDAFRRRRVAIGLRTRVQAAAVFCVTADAVKKWERGERPIAAHALNTLARLESEKAKPADF